MKKHYDFDKMKGHKNPYVKLLKDYNYKNISDKIVSNYIKHDNLELLSNEIEDVIKQVAENKENFIFESSANLDIKDHYGKGI